MLSSSTGSSSSIGSLVLINEFNILRERERVEGKRQEVGCVERKSHNTAAPPPPPTPRRYNS